MSEVNNKQNNTKNKNNKIENNKNKGSKKKILISVILVILLGLMIFSGYKIISYIIDTNNNKQIIDETNKSLSIDEGKSDDDESKYTVDFENLKNTNSDTVAYLIINGLDIKYPVVQSNNNDFYLNHNFNKQYNSGGWVFGDYRNNFDGTDKNIILYGHNMKNGTMFANLKDSFNKEWANNEDNKRIVLITESGTWFYEVFSVYDIEVEDYYITTSFSSSQFEKFIKTMKSRSAYDFGTEVSGNDNILTLSTCSTENRRVVMQAKRVK